MRQAIVATVGVLADTHVPDRVRELHPEVIPSFQAAGVSHILHAGDVCSPGVLETLSAVAPVSAVRGNRDWLLGSLPLEQEIELGGVKIGLMHGHGNFTRYLWDKLYYIARGYRLKRYVKLLTGRLPDASVIVYGHTHHPELLWYQGKLLFNPGSASFSYHYSQPPSVGLLHIHAGGSVSAEYIHLKGYRVRGRTWEKTTVYSPVMK